MVTGSRKVSIRCESQKIFLSVMLQMRVQSLRAFYFLKSYFPKLFRLLTTVVRWTSTKELDGSHFAFNPALTVTFSFTINPTGRFCANSRVFHGTYNISIILHYNIMPYRKRYPRRDSGQSLNRIFELLIGQGNPRLQNKPSADGQIPGWTLLNISFFEWGFLSNRGFGMRYDSYHMRHKKALLDKYIVE